MSQPTEIHTLAGAYALDALTEIERAGFARHVADCQACATEVAELTETASRLSAPAWEAPPPRMRDAVFAEVGQTRQVTAGSAHRAERTAHSEVQRWRRRASLALAAGVIALAGMGTVWVVQEQRVDDAQQQAQQLQAAQARVAAIAAAGDAQFRSVSVPGGGTMTVAISRQLGDGVVLMENLPRPPAGKVYQLWLIEGNRPTSIAVMADGQVSGTVTVESLGNADSIGVTLEPTGGSATPTFPTVTGVTLA
jgi:anti-sigma-K factor RskA